MRALEHKILLENVDIRWMEHIDAMEQLKTGIGLRAYARRTLSSPSGRRDLIC